MDFKYAGHVKVFVTLASDWAKVISVGVLLHNQKPGAISILSIESDINLTPCSYPGSPIRNFSFYTLGKKFPGSGKPVGKAKKEDTYRVGPLGVCGRSEDQSVLYAILHHHGAWNMQPSFFFFFFFFFLTLVRKEFWEKFFF